MYIEVRPATSFDDVRTRAMFEQAGFVHAADTSSVLADFPRVLMRLDLGDAPPAL